MPKRKSLSETLIKEMTSLFLARPDAVVRKMFSPDDDSPLEATDTRLISEIKRSKDGGLEIKFIDRHKLAATLLALPDPAQTSAQTNPLSLLLSAIDRAAAGEEEPKS